MRVVSCFVFWGVVCVLLCAIIGFAGCLLLSCLVVLLRGWWFSWLSCVAFGLFVGGFVLVGCC